MVLLGLDQGKLIPGYVGIISCYIQENRVKGGIMGHQTEKQMDNKLETVITQGFCCAFPF